MIDRLTLCSLLRIGENLEANRSHRLAIAHGRFLVLLGNVLPAGVRRVLVAERRQALRDADARAVELAHNPLLLRRRRARRRRVDEVRRPPERDRLIGQPKSRHDLGHVLPEEPARQIREQRLLRPVERVDRTRAAHCRDAALLRLLVDDPDQLRAHAVVTKLTFDNARAEALVYELATGRLAALQVLARACRFTRRWSSKAWCPIR